MGKYMSTGQGVGTDRPALYQPQEARTVDGFLGIHIMSLSPGIRHGCCPLIPPSSLFD
jgi:hypothetical protein